jgi:hypothetical protein
MNDGVGEFSVSNRGIFARLRGIDSSRLRFDAAAIGGTE